VPTVEVTEIPKIDEALQLVVYLEKEAEKGKNINTDV
jgi:hypothetical protein